MEDISSFSPILFSIISSLDVPSLYTIWQSEDNLISNGTDTGIRQMLTEKYCLNFLCEKYALPVQENFIFFFLLWQEKRLFHEKTSLDYLLTNWETVFPQRIALRKAAKAKRFDFVDTLFTQRRLWYSYYDVEAVCLGCCWSLEKVKEYLKNFEASGLNRDILTNCEWRAFQKHYLDSGFEFDSFLEDPELLLAYGYWDLFREREHKEIHDLVSLILHHPSGRLSLDMPEVPEDLKQYLEIFNKGLWLQHYPVTAKFFRKGLHLPPFAQRVNSYYFPDDFLSNLDCAEYSTGGHYFFAKNINNGIKLDYLSFEPHCDFFELDFIIWCLEQDLQDRYPELESRLQKVFAALLGNQVGELYYHPYAIQYFCENFREDFEIASADLPLKEALLKVVKGDKLMTEYVNKL